MTNKANLSPASDTTDVNQTAHLSKRKKSPLEIKLRKVRKKRETWTQRRQYVQSKMLGLTLIVFSVLVVTILLNLLAEWDIPYVVEGTLIIAAIAMMIWSVFNIIENFVVWRYKRLSKKSKEQLSKNKPRHRRTSGKSRQHRDSPISDDSML